MRHISKKGLKLLKQWEGLKRQAYQDVGGVWTIGYGHTNSNGHYNVTKGMKITEEEAERYLLEDLSIYEACVEKHVKVPLTDDQFSALVSFCYNVGTRNFIKSTLLKRLNDGFYDAVPAELQRWNKVRGKYCKGLSNRRRGESGLWGEDQSRTLQIKAEDRRVKTALNVDMLSSVIGSLSGLGGVISGQGVIQYAFAFIMVFAAIMAAIILYKRLGVSKL